MGVLEESGSVYGANASSSDFSSIFTGSPQATPTKFGGEGVTRTEIYRIDGLPFWAKI